MTATAAAPRAATPTDEQTGPELSPEKKAAVAKLLENVNEGNLRHRAMPADIRAKFEMAEALFESGLVPEGYKNVHAVYFALQKGDELGLSPTAALEQIAVVKGKTSIMYMGALAVVMASGKLEDYRETYDEQGIGCTVYAKRRGIPTPLAIRWTSEDVVRAGLQGNTLHKSYPRDGVRNRAGIRVLRSLFGDVLCGIPLVDELEDAAAERAAKAEAAYRVPAAEFTDVKARVARAAQAKTLDAAGLEALYRNAVGTEIPKDEKGVSWERISDLGRASWEAFAAAVRGLSVPPRANGIAAARTGGSTAASPRPTGPAPAPALAPVAERARAIGRKYGLDEAALLATVRSSTPHTALEQLTDGDLALLDDVLSVRDDAQKGGDR